MGKSMREEVGEEVDEGAGATLGTFGNGICCLGFSSV